MDRVTGGGGGVLDVQAEEMNKLNWAEEYVLTKLASGSCPKEIASDRNVTITAISKIGRHAKEKLGARTLYQAVAMFARERK